MASSRKSLTSKFSMEVKGTKKTVLKPSAKVPSTAATAGSTPSRKISTVSKSGTPTFDKTKKGKGKIKTEDKKSEIQQTIALSSVSVEEDNREVANEARHDEVTELHSIVNIEPIVHVKVNIPTTAEFTHSSLSQPPTVCLKDVNLDFKDLGQPDTETTLKSEVEDSKPQGTFRPIFRLGSHESQKTDDEDVLQGDNSDLMLDLSSEPSSINSNVLSSLSNVSIGMSSSSESAAFLREKIVLKERTRRSIGHCQNIREAQNEDFENVSLSSSGFSPSSTSASLRSYEGHSGIDDFSDDSDGPAGMANRLRESIDLSDDMQDLEVASFNVPLNKQLKIVTSLDRGLKPKVPEHRRSSSPANLDIQTGGGLLKRLSHHLLFVDFMRRKGLSSLMANFPSDMTIEVFR